MYEEHICSSSCGDRRSRHAYPHITLMISIADTVHVFLRKPRAAPCRERGKNIHRGHDTAPFSRRTTSSSIAFSLKDVCLSHALIRGISYDTLSSVGVVTTTANEKDAVCVHTTTHERNIPVCAVSAALQDVSPWLDKSSRYRVTRFFVCGQPYRRIKKSMAGCPQLRAQIWGELAHRMPFFCGLICPWYLLPPERLFRPSSRSHWRPNVNTGTRLHIQAIAGTPRR